MAQDRDGKPQTIWIQSDGTPRDKLAAFAASADRERAAVCVIPGTVAKQGEARAADVLQMQALVVDLDAGDIPAKRELIVSHPALALHWLRRHSGLERRVAVPAFQPVFSSRSWRPADFRSWFPALSDFRGYAQILASDGRPSGGMSDRIIPAPPRGD